MQNMREKWPDSYNDGKQSEMQSIDDWIKSGGTYQEYVQEFAQEMMESLREFRQILETGITSDNQPLKDDHRLIIEQNCAHFEGCLSCFD